MQQFKNLVSHCEPETTLFRQEIDLLVELIQGVLEKVAPRTTRGTFILDGQKYGEEAKCILRFNLLDGIYHCRAGDTGWNTSDQLAEKAIDEMLAIPGISRYINGGFPVQHQISNSERNMQNGVYREDELMVLIVNATHGRFLASCYLKDDDNGAAAELVLCAVAQAIAAMGKEDITLQRSDSSIFDTCQRCAVDGCLEIRQHIENTFQVGSGLAMMAWRAWHEPANANGELTLFFE